MKFKNKALYYILNLTWGLPLTAVGAIVALVLMVLGKKPRKCGPCIHFEVGKDWGGLSLGLFIFTNENVAKILKLHEIGHTLQNAIYGPFMIILTVISASRYWLCRIFNVSVSYYSFWLEIDASHIGDSLMTIWRL